MVIQDETTRKLLDTSTHKKFKAAFKKRWPGSEGLAVDVDQDTQIIKISGYGGYKKGPWEITNKAEPDDVETATVVYFKGSRFEQKALKDIVFNLRAEDL